MDVYGFDSYKQALRELLLARKAQFGARFTFEKMAIACGIQKTYLSKVLNGEGQLNPDQLYAAAEFLGLTVESTEFMLLLREGQLSTHAKRTTRIQQKIQRLRTRNLKTESAISVTPQDPIRDHLWDYYSNIDLQLVHLFLTVPRFAADPTAIGGCIGVHPSRVDEILIQLQQWKLIRFVNERYEVTEPKLHLSESSPAFAVFGVLMRVKTLESLQRKAPTAVGDYFFSALFSAETGFRDRFRKQLLQLLKEAQSEVVASRPQEVYQLNIDFFRWS